MTSCLLVAALASADPWPTFGYDGRRTGQSSVSAATDYGSSDTLQSYAVSEGSVINIPATVDSDGNIYFGTWGVLRSFDSDDRTEWSKFDGQILSLTADMELRWVYQPPDVPYCYDYDGREDRSFCPDGGAVSWYNGTVEGTGALSEDESVIYVGRGDGRLYALDTVTGEEVWQFETFNPLDPDDPDGGGEVVGGPLVGDDGAIYIATVGVGDYESNAVYAVETDGTLRWRYPEDEHTADNTFWTAPAVSPDGQTLYVAGGLGREGQRPRSGTSLAPCSPSTSASKRAMATSDCSGATPRWSRK